MNESQIYAALTEIFHDLFGDDSIVLRPETTAKDVDGWDSFNTVNLIVAAEIRFGIKVQTGEFETLKSVGDFVSLIARKL